jgi:hypothetical protein
MQPTIHVHHTTKDHYDIMIYPRWRFSLNLTNVMSDMLTMFYKIKICFFFHMNDANVMLAASQISLVSSVLVNHPVYHIKTLTLRTVKRYTESFIMTLYISLSVGDVDECAPSLIT